LFRSVEIALASLYVITTAVLVTGIYTVHQILGIEKWGIILFVSLIFALIAGRVLAKIAITPLKEHFDHLELFSKETLHELNLPISTITVNVEMLRKTHSDEKSLKRLERIGQAVGMLKERYNELDYLIKKQMERESIEPFDLNELLQERLGFLRGLYPNVTWAVISSPCEVRLDRIGLGKVIDNLVENGVKYSSSPAHIRVTLSPDALSICDQGIGMDEITLMRIYDRYYQNDATMAGYGIGLGLVKRYCDRHGILLHVNSRPSEGTCVKLEFKKSNTR
jgi:two-component system, OmpR family, sensor kinase